MVSSVGPDKEIYNRRAKIEESFLGYSILVVINFHIPYLVHANTAKSRLVVHLQRDRPRKYPSPDCSSGADTSGGYLFFIISLPAAESKQ